MPGLRQELPVGDRSSESATAQHLAESKDVQQRGYGSCR